MDYGKYDLVLYYSQKFQDWKEGQIIDIIHHPKKPTKYKIRTESNNPFWQEIYREHHEVKILRRRIIG